MATSRKVIGTPIGYAVDDHMILHQPYSQTWRDFLQDLCKCLPRLLGADYQKMLSDFATAHPEAVELRTASDSTVTLVHKKGRQTVNASFLSWLHSVDIRNYCKEVITQ